MTSHAKLSPSSAHRWIPCPASIFLEKDLPNTSSEHADLGTVAHFLASESLEQNKNALDFLDRQVWLADGYARWSDLDEKMLLDNYFTIDAEMCENVQKYLDAVRSQAEGNQLLVEQRVDFSESLGTDNAFGTSDAIILTDTEIQVHDLKYGKGVQVFAENNEQLQLYALGALSEYSLFGDFTQVRMVIHQPRLDHVSEAVLPVEDIHAFAEKAKVSVTRIQAIEIGADPNNYAVAGEKQCYWCKAKATCPTLQQYAFEIIVGDFEDLSQLDLEVDITNATAQVADLENEILAKHYAAIPLIKLWIDATETRVYQKKLHGEDVPGFKLVQGRKGNRAWSNPEEAETLLKSMRLKTEQMYDLKLISPTTAEKLMESDVIGPRQWSKVKNLITQSDGKPTVVPTSDKRPALVTNSINDFEDLTV